MESLIQGDNKPIILEMDEPVCNIGQFSAVLYGKDEEYKRWNEKNAQLKDTIISLPLTQKDTLALKEKFVNLEVKFLADDSIEFFHVITLLVVARKDSTVFEIGGVMG